MAFHFERASLAALPANLAALPAVAPVMWLGMLSARRRAGGGRAGGAAERPQRVLPRARRGGCALGRGAPGRDARRPHRLGVRRSRSSTPAERRRCGAVRGWRRTSSRPAVARGGRGGSARRGCGARLRLPTRPRRGSSQSRSWTSGQGDATLLQAPGGAAVLVDGGPPGAGLAAKLRDHGVRALDVVVLTHAQEDHQGGLEEVVRSFPVRMLLDGGLPQRRRRPPPHRVARRARGAQVRAARARASCSGSARTCDCGCCPRPTRTRIPDSTRTCARP